MLVRLSPARAVVMHWRIHDHGPSDVEIFECSCEFCNGDQIKLSEELYPVHARVEVLQEHGAAGCEGIPDHSVDGGPFRPASRGVQSCS